MPGRTDPPHSKSALRSGRALVALLVSLAVALSLSSAGCDLRRNAQQASATHEPRIRIHALGGVAAAIEPCGCVKDMLGGVDHAAQWIRGPSPARGTLTLAAGPLFFADPVVSDNEKTQALLKAEAVADALRTLKLAAYAPGANDWAFGSGTFRDLIQRAGVAPLAANVRGESGLADSRLMDVEGVLVGVVGVARPVAERAPRPELQVDEPGAKLEGLVSELKARGAKMLVLVSTLPRGEALRLIERMPAFQLAILGKPFEAGEQNDGAFEPELLGSTLVVQAPNHLQGVVTVDFFVKDGRFEFADGSGLKELGERARMKGRLEDLKARVARARAGGGVADADLSAREREIREIEAALGRPSQVKPPEGSYFRYQYVEVRESLGSLEAVRTQLAEYYQRVNETNRTLFAERRPKPVEPGQAAFLGAEACKSCHAEEYAFWTTTRHYSAYPTLVDGHKQYNLDCVGCHVTGYEAPGGSTVTHVGALEGVQCEVCHGPGSLHRERPNDLTLIRPMPPESFCADSCHHPPHVKADWQVRDAWPHIIGPGHGLPAAAAKPAP